MTWRDSAELGNDASERSPAIAVTAGGTRQQGGTATAAGHAAIPARRLDGSQLGMQTPRARRRARKAAWHDGAAGVARARHEEKGTADIRAGNGQ